MRTARDQAGQSALLMPLIQAIVSGDEAHAVSLLTVSPFLATQAISRGATREEAIDFFFREIMHYLYAGDTPLHAAAAGYQTGIARELVRLKADLAAKNRRGAEPLHYACDGGPTSHTWNPRAQANMVTFLIESGANPNSFDKSGVGPLHRAVRQRCTSAVEALLRGGADVRLKNKSGSTPLHLAVQPTGRGGSGTDQAREQQVGIIKLLLERGASPADKDGRGKRVRQAATSEWIRMLLNDAPV